MRDYVNIGPTPCDEDCVSLTSNGGYHQAMRAECERYIAAIRMKLGPEPRNARLAVKRFDHDFGDYLEVVCWYEDTNPAARNYASRCETDAPRTWNDATFTPSTGVGVGG